MNTLLTFPNISVLLRVSWQQFILRFDVILGANLLFGLPLFALIDWLTPRDISNLPVTTSIDAIMQLMQNQAYVRYMVAQATVGWLTSVIVLIVSVAILNVYVQKSTELRDVLLESKQFILRALIITFVMPLLTLIGYAVFIVPGIILSVMAGLLLPALVWHNETIWQTFVTSWKVLRPHLGRVVLYSIIAELLVASVIIVVTFSLPSQPGFTTAALTIGSIINSFYAVFMAAVFTALQGIKDVQELAENALPKEEV